MTRTPPASLGILCLANKADRSGEPPGAIGNPATFPFPILPRPVPGAWARNVLARDASLAQAHVEMAQQLVREGAVAITAHCGYAISYQQAVREAVDVPVALSALMQLPFLLPLLRKDRKIGVICAEAALLKPELFALAGVAEADPRMVVAGLDGTETLEVWMRPTYKTDWSMVERDTLDVVRRLLTAHPEISLILLECTGLPPISNAIRAQTGLPVFDWVTLCKSLMTSLRQ